MSAEVTREFDAGAARYDLLTVNTGLQFLQTVLQICTCTGQGEKNISPLLRKRRQNACLCFCHGVADSIDGTHIKV